MLFRFSFHSQRNTISIFLVQNIFISIFSRKSEKFSLHPYEIVLEWWFERRASEASNPSRECMEKHSWFSWRGAHVVSEAWGESQSRRVSLSLPPSHGSAWAGHALPPLDSSLADMVGPSKPSPTSSVSKQ
jgi:hypothetical protein